MKSSVAPPNPQDALERDDQGPAPTALPSRRRPTVRESVADAWRSRHLIRELSSGLFFRQFDGFVLGPLWLPIQVGFATVGFVLIFGGVLGLNRIEGVPYYLYSLVGIFALRMFDRGLIFTVRSFYRFRKITSQFAVPLILIPIAATAQGILEWSVYLLFIAGFMIYYSVSDGTLYLEVGPELLLIPVGILWCLLLAWGIGFVTGPIFVRARDIRMLVRMALPFLLFVTPVLYPIDRLHGVARTVAEINPLTAVVEFLRIGFLGIGSISPWSLAASLAVTVVAVTIGLLFLNRFGLSLIGADRLANESDEADSDRL